MAYQDHLTRQIEQFGMVLRRLLSGLTGSPGTQEAASATQVEQALDEALDLTHGTLVTLSPEALIALLRTRPECSELNMDLLADLYLSLAEDPHNATRSSHYRQIARNILEHLNATSNTFDPERHGKVARLKAQG